MKFLSTMILCAASLMAREVDVPTLPSLNPAAQTVTYDKATDNVVLLPPVNITSKPTSPFFYFLQVPSEYAGVISANQLLGVLGAGRTGAVQLSVNASTLAVGVYHITLNFAQSPDVLNYDLTLTVTNSREYVLPGANDRLLPHIAAGADWVTKVRLVNTSQSEEISEIRFYEASGLSTNFTVNGFSTSYLPAVRVPANGYVDLTLTNPAGLKVGTATIKSIIGSAPGVNAIYRNSTLKSESAVEIKPSTQTGFNIVFDNMGRNSTGVAVANALNYDQEVTLEFYDANGVKITAPDSAPVRVRVPANGQVIFISDQAYPITAGKNGVIRVLGTQPALSGFGLLFNMETGVFYTQPAF
jgi:hypothetical protein